jgi:predicted phosphodiesterase
MLFQLASDLHIEKLYPNQSVITDFIVPCAEILILAGDIGSIYHYESLKIFFESCIQHFSVVLYVPGNNEYYSREGFERKTFKEQNEDFERICKDTGVLLLNNSYIELDNCLIFGSTWWSSIPDVLHMRIDMDTGREINADDFNYLHSLSRKSLNWLLHKNETDKKPLLVISHYCPTKLGTMNSHHRRDDFIDLVPYYFSASEKYLSKDIVHTWVYGHTHVFRDFDFNRDQTRIISNADPRKRFFRKNFVFEFP